MPLAHDARSGRATLIYRHHERLYRLALLVAGDVTAAAALVQSAYQQLPVEIDNTTDTESFLIRALLDDRRLRRARWALGAPDLTRATLDRTQVTELFRALAALPPAERLVIGLTYINGSAPDEIAALLGAALGDQPPAEILTRFRAAAARAVGLAPRDADDTLLMQLDRLVGGQLAEADALVVRRELLARPELRDLRDGVIALRDLLPRAIPALFAVATPPALADQLLALVQADRPAQLPKLSMRRPQLLLAIGVLALTAAIVLLPTLVGRLGEPTAGRAPTVAELLDNAIHRFDRAPLQAGVLHEQYRVERDQQSAYLIERWYDYAPPHRLAITVHQEGRDGPPLMSISSDGRSLAQFRYDGNRSYGASPLDIQLSAAEAQRVVPLLRGLPHEPSFARSEGGPGDASPLFLAQARAANTSYLGQVSLLGRPAFLLTYQTSQLPSAAAEAPNKAPVRVLLTIDAQTYALLDIAVIGAGEAESAAQHPVRGQQFEVLAEAPDTRFTLPPAPDVIKRAGMTSVRFPFIDGDALLSIDAAARRTADQLLAPLDLPDQQMRALAIKSRGSNDTEIVLLYEGEFQNIIVLPNFSLASSQQLGEEQSAGAFRYRLIDGVSFGEGIAAVVYRPEQPTKPLGLILNDDFATVSERQATLQNLIASLTPIDDRSLPALRRNFLAPSASVGSS